MLAEQIPPHFIQYAADVLSSNLSGANIVRATVEYALEYNVNIPHSMYPFIAPNKRTALFENLMAFGPTEQYKIITDLCGHRYLKDQKDSNITNLKIRLLSRYGHLSTVQSNSDINETLIEETRHWLDSYPDSLNLYNSAMEKYNGRIFHRNLLDDLRLSLEKLLQAVFTNRKSLENQIPMIGEFIKRRGGSKELSNMFVKLIDYYASYHNSYVKHDDSVNEQETEFVFEITSSFMKHLVRLHAD